MPKITGSVLVRQIFKNSGSVRFWFARFLKIAVRFGSLKFLKKWFGSDRFALVRGIADIALIFSAEKFCRSGRTTFFDFQPEVLEKVVQRDI